jgi:hypothetical protein
MNDETAVPRRAGTVRKQIRMTPHGLEEVQRWAGANNSSFSAAIESLALIGLEDDIARVLVPLVLSVVSRTVERALGRYAKLTAFAAIEAGTASRLTGALLLQEIRQQAQGAPDTFEVEMQVRRDDGALAGRVMALHKELHDHAVYETVRRLKRPLAEIEAVLGTAGEGEDGQAS